MYNKNEKFNNKDNKQIVRWMEDNHDTIDSFLSNCDSDRIFQPTIHQYYFSRIPRFINNCRVGFNRRASSGHR